MNILGYMIYDLNLSNKVWNMPKESHFKLKRKLLHPSTRFSCHRRWKSGGDIFSTPDTVATSPSMVSLKFWRTSGGEILTETVLGDTWEGWLWLGAVATLTLFPVTFRGAAPKSTWAWVWVEQGACRGEALVVGSRATDVLAILSCAVDWPSSAQASAARHWQHGSAALWDSLASLASVVASAWASTIETLGLLWKFRSEAAATFGFRDIVDMFWWFRIQIHAFFCCVQWSATGFWVLSHRWGSEATAFPTSLLRLKTKLGNSWWSAKKRSSITLWVITVGYLTHLKSQNCCNRFKPLLRKQSPESKFSGTSTWATTPTMSSVVSRPNSSTMNIQATFKTPQHWSTSIRIYDPEVLMDYVWFILCHPFSFPS